MFRKLTTAFLVGLCFAIGLASAQVITRSVQLSQDPSGPFGVDANNNLYMQGNRHLNASSGSSGGVPSLGTCTNGVITAGSTDFSGQVTAASAATCAVVFGQAFATAPRCTAGLGTTNAGPVFFSAVTTTGFTWNQAATATTFNWICVSVS
jgi:hypothetical protein